MDSITRDRKRDYGHNPDCIKANQHSDSHFSSVTPCLNLGQNQQRAKTSDITLPALNCICLTCFNARSCKKKSQFSKEKIYNLIGLFLLVFRKPEDLHLGPMSYVLKVIWKIRAFDWNVQDKNDKSRPLFFIYNCIKLHWHHSDQQRIFLSRLHLYKPRTRSLLSMQLCCYKAAAREGLSPSICSKWCLPQGNFWLFSKNAKFLSIENVLLCY